MSVKEQQDCDDRPKYVNKNKGSVHAYSQEHYKDIITRKPRFKL